MSREAAGKNTSIIQLYFCNDDWLYFLEIAFLHMHFFVQLIDATVLAVSAARALSVSNPSHHYMLLHLNNIQLSKGR